MFTRAVVHASVLTLFLAQANAAFGGDPAPKAGDAPYHFAHEFPPFDAPAATPQPRITTPPRQIRLNGYLSVQVNVDEFGNNITNDAANEPTLAVDPTNPDRMVIGWRQFDQITSNYRRAGNAYSHDGGTTWVVGPTLESGAWRSDPVLDVLPDGTFLYNSINSSYLCQVFRSTDGGVTWSAPLDAFGGDKAWMTVDRTGGIGDGNVYCIW